VPLAAILRGVAESRLRPWVRSYIMRQGKGSIVRDAGDRANGSDSIGSIQGPELLP